MSPPALRLAIADDHALFRAGLKSLLSLEPGLAVVVQVERADELVPALGATPCDILLLDLQMDRWLLDDIPALAQRVSVLVLTASEKLEDALAALRAGARAIVQKRFAIETLVEAIYAVAQGQVWMPPALQTEVAAQWADAPKERLTMRETEIVKLVAGGMRNAEVARQLSLAESTVKTHLNNVFQKLALRDRVALAHYALRAGLIGVRGPRR
ncbi:MAG TPA: response regulator transcription factor [Candidatus Binataceae bacterium]|jgi:DNA-binding NarL/FixJ family response regulator|nr:response regulator transcription factor [Candidatus Binataceae bacterium]